MRCLQLCCSTNLGTIIIKTIYAPKHTKPTTVLNLTFTNKIGLAAGFDKNAAYLKSLEALGFGYVEVGTITPIAQAGNAKPRLFRLKHDHALINRMGFNNDGLSTIAQRLKQWQARNSSLIIGGNIGKNKDTPNELAWQDYVTCFAALHPYVHYFVVNVSSPNTPGLRALQDKESLRLIFNKLHACNNALAQPKPILLKIAPDLTTSQVTDVVHLVQEMHISGLVVSNTTLNRAALSSTGQLQAQQYGAGGLSGAPLTIPSTQLIQYIHQVSGGTIPIIGSGGISTVQDAQAKYAAGASLLQVYTGFVYVGPGIVRKLAKV